MKSQIPLESSGVLPFDLSGNFLGMKNFSGKFWSPKLYDLQKKILIYEGHFGNKINYIF